MLFSIVIPVYNVEKYIDECLCSVIKQVNKLDEFCEIILIDDGSQDMSGKICDKYREQYPNIIKVFHNKNNGLLLTRRFGYKQANGDYIINCDSDDKMEENALITLRDTIVLYSYPDVIFYNHYSFTEDEKKIGFKNIFTSEEYCVVSKKHVIKEFMQGHRIVNSWGSACKRECINVDKDYTKYGYINNGEDSLQKLEIFDHASQFVYVNKALYDYRIDSGMTGKFDPNYYFEFKTVIEQIERRKEHWKIQEFEELITIKALSSIGRAITQSRYGEIKIKEHIEYLKKIREDEMAKKYLSNLEKAFGKIQKEHWMLLYLLQKKLYFIIVCMLNIKNSIGDN